MSGESGVGCWAKVEMVRSKVIDRASACLNFVLVELGKLGVSERARLLRLITAMVLPPGGG